MVTYSCDNCGKKVENIKHLVRVSINIQDPNYTQLGDEYNLELCEACMAKLGFVKQLADYTIETEHTKSQKALYEFTASLINIMNAIEESPKKNN